MKCTAKELLNIATDELGYFGKKNKSDNTDVKEAPNGVGKFNKYSRELAKLNWYNSGKDGAAWCAIFVDWCIYKACSDSKEDTNKVKPQAVAGCGAGVYYSRMALKNQWVSTPKAGDIFFHKDDSHTGFVSCVWEDGTFDTLEGNWGNMVTSRKRLKISDFNFARPNYEEEKPEPVPVPEPEPFCEDDCETEDNNWITVFENNNIRVQVNKDIVSK